MLLLPLETSLVCMGDGEQSIYCRDFLPDTSSLMKSGFTTAAVSVHLKSWAKQIGKAKYSYRRVEKALLRMRVINSLVQCGQ